MPSTSAELLLELVKGITLPSSGSDDEYVATGYYIGIKPKSNNDSLSYKNNIDKGTLSIIKGIVLNDWVYDISLHEPDNYNKSAKQIFIKYKKNSSNKTKKCDCSILLEYNDTSTILPFTITLEANIPQLKYITFEIEMSYFQFLGDGRNEFRGAILCTSFPSLDLGVGGNPPTLGNNSSGNGGGSSFIPGGDNVDLVGGNNNTTGTDPIVNIPISTTNTVYAVSPPDKNHTYYYDSSISIPNKDICYLIIQTSYRYVYKRIEKDMLISDTSITITSNDGYIWKASN